MPNLSKGKDNLKVRKYDKKIFETSDTNDKKYVSSDVQTHMSASFAAGDHIQDTNSYYITAPILYQLQLMQEEIDELRTFISTELATTSSLAPVSASFASTSASISNMTSVANNQWILLKAGAAANLPEFKNVQGQVGRIYLDPQKDGTKILKST